MANFPVQQTGLARCRYVTASVYQMLRGAEILFSAIFAVTFLKRPLNKLHYGGIAGCLAGICLVGASSLLSPGGGGSSQAGMVLLGMALIVIAQVGLHPGKLCATRPSPLLLTCWQPILSQPSRSSLSPCRDKSGPLCRCSLLGRACLLRPAIYFQQMRLTLLLSPRHLMLCEDVLAQRTLMLRRLCKLPR